MKIDKILLIITILILSFGCSTISPEKELRVLDINYKTVKTSVVPVDYLEYSEGKKEFLVFYSNVDSDLEAFIREYQKLTDGEVPQFEGSMIIAKSGTKPNGGYKISIQSVKDLDSYIEVTTLFESPGDECLVTMALTNPYIIVLLEDNYKDVKFVEKSVKVDCR